MLIAKTRQFFLKSDRVRIVDWVLAGTLITMCVLLFSQGGDLDVTIRHGLTMLDMIFKGQNLYDFYTVTYYNALSGVYSNGLAYASLYYAANYTIFLYFLIALACLPVYLFGILFHFVVAFPFYLFYIKFILVGCAALAAWFMYRLGLKLSLSPNRSKWMAFGLLTSPVLLFANFAFGQVDIIAVLFVIISLNFYVTKKTGWFLLFMALAVDYKFFAFFAAVVLILLVEKRLPYIVRNIAAVASLLVLEKIVFSFSEGYKLTSAFMNTTYGFYGRLFTSGVQGLGFISFIVLGFFIIIILAYRKKVENQLDLQKSMILYPLAMYIVFFIFIVWHPAWFVIIIPFLTLCLFYFQEFRLGLLLDIVFSLCFLAVSVLLFAQNADHSMINDGILPLLTGIRPDTSVSIFNWLLTVKLHLPSTFFYSVLSGSLIMLLYTRAASSNKNPALVADIDEPVERWLVWTRLASILAFIVPSLLWYVIQVMKVSR